MNANDDDLKDLAVDFLPCQFEKDIEETNRDIYFDPCIQKSAEHQDLKEVQLQGRKMVGFTHNLSGYEGRVFGMESDEIDPVTLQRKIQFQQIGKFDKVTEWQKDQWNQGEPLDNDDDQRKFVSDLMDFIECTQILHSDE